MSDINPRIDLAFKKIFGIEENKDLLISLINSTVGKEDQVVDITLLNPYNQQNFKKDKLSILDIKAEGEDGRLFNIEVQIADEGDYDKRALYYWAKLYADQIGASQDYSELEKVIGIHILNFTSIPHAEKYHNAFHITEKETGIHYFEYLELHTIELNKFKEKAGKKLEDLAGKIQSSLDMWSAFLTRHDILTGVPLPPSLDKPELKKALEMLDIMNFTKEEREAYEDRLKWLRIEESSLKKAEKKGREEGEKNKALEIASILLRQGLDLPKISEATGLSIQEITALKKDD